MTDRQIPQRQQCDVKEHQGHLCHLADQYYHVREPARFREMVRDPHFKCDFCGRTAADASNLCYPMPL